MPPKEVKTMKKEVKAMKKAGAQVVKELKKAPVIKAKSPAKNDKVNRDMQKTRNSISDNIAATGLRGAEFELAMSILCPGGAGAVRFPDMLAEKQSACTNTMEKYQKQFGVPISTTSPTYTQFSYGTTSTYPLANETIGIVMKGQLRNAVIYDQNSANAGCAYFNTTTGMGNLPYPLPNLPTPWYPEMPYLVPLGGYNPFHGDRLYSAFCTQDPSISLFWADANQSVIIKYTATSNTVLNLVLVGYNARDWNDSIQTTQTTFTTGNGEFLFKVPSPGYYAVKVCPQGALPAGQVTITGYGIIDHYTTASGVSTYLTGPHLCHFSLRDMTSNMRSVDNIRTIGSSLMWSNYQTELNRGGQAVGFQGGGSLNWLSVMQSSGSVVAALQSFNDNTNIKAADGMYGYVKPTSLDEFKYRNDFALDPNGLVVRSRYQLNGTPDNWLAIACALPVNVQSYGTWSVFNSVEYLTRDTWRDTDISKAPAGQMMIALNKLKFVPQFYENPLHFAAIVSMIKKLLLGATGAVVKYGPSVIRGAQGVNDFVSGLPA